MPARLSARLPAGWRPYALDCALAAAFLVIGQVSVPVAPSANPHPAGLTAAAEAVSAIALAWRRRAPLASITVMLAGMAVLTVATRTSPSIYFFVLTLLLAFGVGSYLAQGRAVLGVGVALAAGCLPGLFIPGQSATDAVLSPIILIGLPWLAGRAQRRQRDQSEELARLARQLKEERDERAREAVAAERVRIARDLHDVIAHSVSVMIVQAGAAEQVLDLEPDRARQPLNAIRQTGKAALDDMRRLLGVLRTDADGLGLAPQPTLADLGQLAERFSAAGLPVDLAIDGDHAGLAPGIEMTAYRVCQEALTNALKHGGGRASLTLNRSRDAVEIAVLDDGAGRPAAATDGGHGLVGMRERVALYGGELRAGTRPEGGFAVQARLPCEHVPA